MATRCHHMPSHAPSVSSHLMLQLVNCAVVAQRVVLMWDINTYTAIKKLYFVLFFSALETRYEVAPRSDSEESGSEFEEEVSASLITDPSQWTGFHSAASAAAPQSFLSHLVGSHTVLSCL